VAASTSMCSLSLRVLTWNVMFDDFLEQYPPSAASALRAPGLADAICGANADIVVMQEATHSVVAAVDALWPVGGWRTAILGELVVWSRHRIRRALSVPLGANTSKQALLVEVGLQSRSAAFACVHFTSDRRGNQLLDHTEKRAKQARIVRDALASLMGAADHFVCGDFNEPNADGAFGAVSVMTGLVDVWPAIHGASDGGWTFDPTRNALAAVAALAKIPRRIDRIFASPKWNPVSAKLLGEAEELSDHYGVVADLAFTSNFNITKSVHTSALVFIPPESCWPQIDAIRSRYDPSFGRWMAHVNLIYGFLPEDQFAEASLAMETVVRRHGPVEVRFEELMLFEHGSSSASVVVVPSCAPLDGLTTLQADLEALFPTCQEQSRHGTYLPHLTLGKFNSLEDARRCKAELTASWSPIIFVVDELQLIARSATGGPFAGRARMPLGSRLHGQDCELLETLEAAGNCRAFAVGSAVLLGSERPTSSDLDVLLVGDRSGADVFADLERALRPSNSRQAQGRFPILEMELQGVQLDIMYARSERWDHPATWLCIECAEGGLASGALQDALALRNTLLKERGLRGLHLFQRALPKLRRWTKARQIDSNALGFLGGWSWGLILANTLLHSPSEIEANVEDDPADLLVSATQRRFAVWPWPTPVCVSGVAVAAAAATQARELMPILSPCKPFANSARNVTVSTLAVMSAELRSAAAGEAATAMLGHFSWFIRSEVQGTTPESKRACAWLKSRLLTLIRRLEHMEARPLQLGTGLWVIAAATDPHTLRRFAEEFGNRISEDNSGENWSHMVEIAVEDKQAVRQLVQKRATSKQPRAACYS